jgi:hypothetical protein
MRRTTQIFTLSAAFMVLGCVAEHDNGVVRPALVPGPSSDANSESGVQILDALLAGPSLRLTADGSGSSRQFHFLSRVVSANSSGAERETNTFIIRDGPRVAAVSMSATGLPYCCATRGLLACLDPSRAGGLVIYRGGAPVFELTTTPEGRLSYDLSYSRTKPDPAIDLNISSLLRSVRTKLRSAEYDADNRSLNTRTEHSKTSILLAPADSDSTGFRVTAFNMENFTSRNTVMILNISTDASAPFDMQSITETRVRGLGLPVRVILADDARTIDLLVPLDFGKNSLEREAAERLRTMLRISVGQRVSGEHFHIRDLLEKHDVNEYPLSAKVFALKPTHGR